MHIYSADSISQEQIDDVKGEMQKKLKEEEQRYETADAVDVARGAK